MRKLQSMATGVVAEQFKIGDGDSNSGEQPEPNFTIARLVGIAERDGFTGDPCRKYALKWPDARHASEQHSK